MLNDKHGRPFYFTPNAPEFRVGDGLHRLIAVDAMPGPLPVWDGGCEGTIYGPGRLGKARNGLFRAWHDSVHLERRLPFTLDGDRLVAIYQCSQARAMMEVLGYDEPDIQAVQTLLMAEIVGQLDYVVEHGDFPADQMACVKAYCEVREAA
jgi:hypothetical protein